MLDAQGLLSPPLYRFDRLYLVASRRLVARLLREELGPARSSLKVLDVGSGGGAWAPELQPYAADYVGLDIVDRPGVTLVASAEKMPLPDDQFDLIFSTTVLEHIRDYRAAVAEMYRVLKPGGLLLLGTHGTWAIHGAPHDYWRWTPYGLQESFSRYGVCRVVQVGGPIMNYFLFRNLYLRGWQERHPRFRVLLSPLVAWNNWLGSWDLDRVAPPAMLPCLYFVVARK